MNRREVIAGGINMMAATMAGRAPSATSSGQTLITRRIPSSGEEIPLIGLGTSGPF